ncbi:hypothetical protein B0J12DRAFT_454633 [Macrophomina phaseolina]|uniref:Uncharacterized protein n=1 Tax=Macrophomina phaseolina TaxID=35725 RepID=A0ABQ8GFN8_9PEZI|nr:hypothetical protein B0J12DRAFT_454633 [Macrophomina phaseolina]
MCAADSTSPLCPKAAGIVPSGDLPGTPRGTGCGAPLVPSGRNAKKSPRRWGARRSAVVLEMRLGRRKCLRKAQHARRTTGRVPACISGVTAHGMSRMWSRLGAASCVRKTFRGRVGQSYEREMRNSPIDAVSAKKGTEAAGSSIWQGPGREACLGRGASGSFELQLVREGKCLAGGRLARWIERRGRRGGGQIAILGPWDMTREQLARRRAVHPWTLGVVSIMQIVQSVMLPGRDEGRGLAWT